MRYVSSFPLRLSIVGGREVKGVSAIRPIRSVLAGNYPAAEIEQYKRYDRHQQPNSAGDQNEPGRRIVFPDDRRQAGLRGRQRTMLVEFRSGKSRRRQNQIDEKA